MIAMRIILWQFSTCSVLDRGLGTATGLQVGLGAGSTIVRTFLCLSALDLCADVLKALQLGFAFESLTWAEVLGSMMAIVAFVCHC